MRSVLSSPQINIKKKKMEGKNRKQKLFFC